MALDPSRIQAICFDVDGTLSDTDDLWTASLEKVIRPLRYLFPRRDAHAVARWAIMAAESPANALYHFLDHHGIDNTVANLANWLSRIRPLARPKHYWMIPRTREMLEAICPHYPLAVISARDAGATLGFLEHYSLIHFFKAIATALTCVHTKPFPDPVFWAAKELGVPSENVLMIGDTVVDIRAGKAAGAQTVGVLCGFGEEEELRRAGADLILPYPADVLPYLQRTNDLKQTEEAD